MKPEAIETRFLDDHDRKGFPRPCKRLLLQLRKPRQQPRNVPGSHRMLRHLLARAGDSDVMSQIERLSSRETKIAARLDWMAVGASGRSATVGMDVSRVGGFATSLCQSSGRYPPPHGIFQRKRTLPSSMASKRLLEMAMRCVYRPT